MIKKIDDQLLDETAKQAKASARRRKNYNFHSSAEDTMHRMLNSLEPGTYIAPHKHQNPDKHEAFIILRGAIMLIVFDEEGHITDYVVMQAGSPMYGAEVGPGVYHTLVCLAPGSVLYELKDGPWHPATDKQFAPWAPAEKQPGTQDYIDKLLEQTNHKLTV